MGLHQMVDESSIAVSSNYVITFGNVSSCDMNHAIYSIQVSFTVLLNAE